MLCLIMIQVYIVFCRKLNLDWPNKKVKPNFCGNTLGINLTVNRVEMERIQETRCLVVVRGGNQLEE